MTKITELAKIIRSKNAGPFMTTIDTFFVDRGAYERVKNSGVMTAETVAGLYRIPAEDVVGIFYHDLVMGIKVTIIKPEGMVSGDPECADTFGASQHVPLKSIEIP